MSVENNKMQVDIDNLFKQNVNDLSSIKELYRRIEEIGEKITQYKYIDNTLVKKLKKEYENLKKIILDENIQLQLDNKIDKFNTKLTNDIGTINSQLDKKVSYPIKNGIEEVSDVVDITKEYGNVQRYGANPVWNATKDDSIAFQKAIDYATSMNISVKIPFGEYVCKTTITLPKTIKIVGEGCDRPIISRINIKTSQLFKAKSGTTVTIDLSGIYFANESDFNIIFSQVELANSKIYNNYFYKIDTFLLGGISHITNIYNNTFSMVRHSLITSSVPNNLNIEGKNSFITDSYITNNYINGYPSANPIMSDASISTSVIEKNYIDYFHTVFNDNGGISSTITRNVFDICYKVFGKTVTGYRIIDNTFQKCSNKYVSNFPNATDEMKNNNWECITTLSSYGSHTVLISNNQSYLVDTFLKIVGGINYDIKSQGNIYENTTNKVDFKPNTLNNNAKSLTGMYIEEMEKIICNTLPSPNCSPSLSLVESYPNQEIIYKNVVLKNINNKWINLLGNEIEP